MINNFISLLFKYKSQISLLYKKLLNIELETYLRFF